MLTEHRFSAYRIMWIFVLFDLPTISANEKKVHTAFRKDLLRAGFTRLQLSIYSRHCTSREHSEKYIRGIKKILPKQGHVNILVVTDKQYGSMLSFYGKKKQKIEQKSRQLELF